jgi:hypothetical protein
MSTSGKLLNISNTEPVRISPPGKHSGLDITIQNINDSGYLYVGANNVSSTNYGYRIEKNTAISFELSGSDSLYVIASDSNMKAAVMQISLEIGN